jgi:prevent-host-death family protein
MSTVGVRELKDRLTRYLKQTKDGEEIVVTERGNPIAIIQPIRTARKAKSLDARLARLAAEGLVTLPTRKRLARVHRVKVKGRPVSRTILEDRR